MAIFIQKLYINFLTSFTTPSKDNTANISRVFVCFGNREGFEQVRSEMRVEFT